MDANEKLAIHDLLGRASYALDQPAGAVKFLRARRFRDAGSGG